MERSPGCNCKRRPVGIAKHCRRFDAIQTKIVNMSGGATKDVEKVESNGVDKRRGCKFGRALESVAMHRCRSSPVLFGWCRPIDCRTRIGCPPGTYQVRTWSERSTICVAGGRQCSASSRLSLEIAANADTIVYTPKGSNNNMETSPFNVRVDVSTNFDGCSIGRLYTNRLGLIWQTTRPSRIHCSIFSQTRRASRKLVPVQRTFDSHSNIVSRRNSKQQCLETIELAVRIHRHCHTHARRRATRMDLLKVSVHHVNWQEFRRKRCFGRRF